MAYMLGRMARQLLLVKAGAAKVSDERSLDALRVQTCGDIIREAFRSECERWQGKWASTEFGDVRAFFQEARAIGKKITELITERVGDHQIGDVRRVRRLHPGLHASHYGFYDVVSTNELATMVKVSKQLPSEKMQHLLTLLGVVPLEGATPREHGKMVRVVLDGRWIGSLSDPNDVLMQLERFDTNVNHSLVDMELSVRTAAGRLQA